MAKLTEFERGFVLGGAACAAWHEAAANIADGQFIDRVVTLTSEDALRERIMSWEPHSHLLTLEIARRLADMELPGCVENAWESV